MKYKKLFCDELIFHRNGVETMIRACFLETWLEAGLEESDLRRR